MTTFILSGGDLDEEEAAAAMAAITCLLEEEAAAALAAVAVESKHEGWRDAARLLTQGLLPGRVPAEPRWSSIERLRRAGRGGGGIVGQ